MSRLALIFDLAPQIDYHFNHNIPLIAHSHATCRPSWGAGAH